MPVLPPSRGIPLNRYAMCLRLALAPTPFLASGVDAMSSYEITPASIGRYCPGRY